MYTITPDKLEQTLTQRINESEAEIAALKAVKINTTHKTLTNRAIEHGRIGDYIGIGKALYVSYQADHRYMSTDISAYSYVDENGAELGAEGYRRISRTISPAELRKVLDDVIAGREKSLIEYKTDLINAKKITKAYNKIVSDYEALTNGVTWATRSVLK